MSENGTTTRDSITTIHVNKFEEDTAKDFLEKFKEAEIKKQKIVPVYIDSYGGQVYSALSMNDVIQSFNGKVMTVAVGKAMSCGLFLLAAGTPGYRFCSKNCSLMLHSISSGTHGKVEDMKVDMKEDERLMKQFFSVMARNCKQKQNYFLDLIKDKMDKDLYMTPREGLKHQVIDKIGIPLIKEKSELVIEV